MRISQAQSQQIVQATQEIAGPGATVRLFGSRLDDSGQGGDIDLLVQCATTPVRPVVMAARLTARLQRKLGERKIDVLVTGPGMVVEPVHAQALRTGQVLS